MSTEHVYDPQQPNLHGYIRWERWRHEPLIVRFAWWLYGRNQVVAWYLHREQSALGKFQNWAAARILNHLYK